MSSCREENRDHHLRASAKYTYLSKHLISSVDSTPCKLIDRKLAWELDNTTNVSKAFFWKRIMK
jgi:hypothetical protein